MPGKRPSATSFSRCASSVSPAAIRRYGTGVEVHVAPGAVEHLVARGGARRRSPRAPAARARAGGRGTRRASRAAPTPPGRGPGRIASSSQLAQPPQRVEVGRHRSLAAADEHAARRPARCRRRTAPGRAAAPRGRARGPGSRSPRTARPRRRLPGAPPRTPARARERRRALRVVVVVVRQDDPREPPPAAATTASR